MESIISLVAPILGILFCAVVAFVGIKYILSRYVPVPPNKALIVYGRGGMRTVTAGGTFILPVLEKTEILSLDIMTITVRGDEVKTVSGVPIMVDWTAQIKVDSEKTGIATAAQVFLGLQEDKVKEKAQLTLGGNLREVISKLTVLQVHTDRDAFISSVQKIIADEMNAMGLKVVSLTIQDVYDPEGQTYFKDMAAKDIAEVQKEARIVRATADREATERESIEAQAKELAILTKEVAIAGAQKDKDLQVADFKKQADTASAEASQAGPLAEAKARQAVVVEQQKVELARTQQEIAVADETAKLTEKQLETSIRKPADAEAYRIEVEAGAARKKMTIDAEAIAESAKKKAEAITATGEADSAVIALKANAEASSIKAKGEAEADSTKAKLLAEAEGQSKLAEALSANGEINLRLQAVEQILKTQVEIAQALAGPMAAIGANIKVVQITGGANDTPSNPVFDAMKQLPQLLTLLNAQSEALTGKGINTLLQEVTQLVQSNSEAVSQTAKDTDKPTETRGQTIPVMVEMPVVTSTPSVTESKPATRSGHKTSDPKKGD